MAEQATSTHITQVATVMVPVANQDRALDFYVESLGFEKVSDFTYGDGERWVEVIPPGAATRVSLVRERGDKPAGVQTGVVFVTDDIEADHDEMRARGVDVDEIMREGHPVVHWAGAPLAGMPPMFLFRDPEGNSLLMVQGS
jgi:catechol 2,3-dioxygenase-like lactoylglutathione lyase family enzyme